MEVVYLILRSQSGTTVSSVRDGCQVPSTQFKLVTEVPSGNRYPRRHVTTAATPIMESLEFFGIAGGDRQYCFFFSQLGPIKLSAHAHNPG